MDLPRDPIRLAPGRPGEDYHEFITTEPPDAVPHAGGLGDLAGYVPKDVVSAGMPVPVVNAFELIEVDQEHCNLSVGGGRSNDALKKIVETATVKYTGQFIAAGLVKKLRTDAGVLYRQRRRISEALC